jgi:cobalamin biosynthetic protein CobC
VPYPVGHLTQDAWTALPDQSAIDRLTWAARAFWSVPDGASIVVAPGASALIARLPTLLSGDRVRIPGPTYNEHAASFQIAGWTVLQDGDADASGSCAPQQSGRSPLGSSRSRGDGDDNRRREFLRHMSRGVSLVGRSDEPAVIVLKSFGKFWGLAGLRLGAMIAIA